MATTVFACGFEGGIDGRWTTAGAPSVITASPLTGLRSLECVHTGVQVGVTSVATFAGSGIIVLRASLKFTTLPDANINIFGANTSGTFGGVRFVATDNSLRAATTGGAAPAGIAISANTQYEVDVLLNTTANPWTCDITVDGVAGTQRTQALAADTTAKVIVAGLLGGAGPTVGTVVIDNIVASVTSGDYPLGAADPNGQYRLVVHGRVPTSDGTHNIAGTADFQRGNTGTDILNATTTAYQLVDDVPLPSGAVDEADCWRAVAPPNATDYVEAVFGALSGDTGTPSGAPLGVEAIAVHHQIATGTGSFDVFLNDNGTTGTIVSASGAAGVTTYRTGRAHFATGPAGAWTRTAGNGYFDDLRVRFRCADANPDQCLDGVMLEAVFAPNPLGGSIVPHAMRYYRNRRAA